MIYYASQVVGTEGANSFYYCYLFGKSAYSVATTRMQTFADLTDFYTSFLFNLLSQSLSIKTIANNINTYSTNGDYVDLAGQIATLFRIIIDFQSSNAAGMTG